MQKRDVILSVFAGRQGNMEVLFAYMNVMMDRDLLQGVHLWNFTRKASDERWLHDNLYGDRAVSATGSAYVALDAPTQTLHFRGADNAHILLCDAAGEPLREIVLGGWRNTRSVVRATPQGAAISEHLGVVCDPDSFVRVDIDADGVSVGGERILSLCGLSAYSSVKVSAWGDRTVEWRTGVAPHGRFKLMHVRNKSKWREYYQHYTAARYPDHVIVKCDDDIVYIDVDGFADFIKRRVADRTSLLAFPSIVNNGVCAHYQQNAGLLGDLEEMPYDVYYGELLMNGELCGRLHSYFLNDVEGFVAASRGLQSIVHPIGDRISINFFAVLSEDLGIFQEIGDDDERDITTLVPSAHGRHVYVDMRFVVAHLSFNTQGRTGLDEAGVLRRYAALLPGAV